MGIHSRLSICDLTMKHDKNSKYMHCCLWIRRINCCRFIITSINLVLTVMFELWVSQCQRYDNNGSISFRKWNHRKAKWYPMFFFLFLDPCYQESFGGNAYGHCCHFPFVYSNQTFYECVDIDRGRPWCSTTYNYDIDGKWGYCSEKEGSSTITDFYKY